MNGHVEVSCDYFDGRTTVRQRATLTVLEGRVVVQAQDFRREEPLSAVRVSERMGKAARIVSFTDGAFCEVHDHAALQQLLDATGFREPLVARMQTRWSLALGAVACCALAVVLGYLYALPWLAARAAEHVPASAVESMSAQTLELLDRHLLDPTELPQEVRDRLSKRFAAMTPPEGAKVAHRIEFRAAPRVGPNAFALPSGTIVVTDALVELAASDEEVMAVLSHELGHVQEKHGIRQVLQSSVVGLFLTWYLGDLSSLIAAVPAAILDARYSRDHERAADAYAARMLRFNAMSPALLASMLEKLEKSRRDERRDQPGSPSSKDYLSTHPATDERMRALRSQ